MDKKAEEIKAMLKKYGQEHLLNYYEKMDDVHKETLLKQIESIDFELINNLVLNFQKNEIVKKIKLMDSFLVGPRNEI